MQEKNNNTPHIYFGLVHYPTLNKRGETVTTSVTNLDVHDLARVCATFNFHGFIITPLEIQQQLIQRIIDYWNKSQAQKYNPDRVQALHAISLIDSIELAVNKINNPLIAITSAQYDKFNPKVMHPYHAYQKSIALNRPILVLFGTGWGLHSDVTDNADFIFPPIEGCNPDNYNHLSVRAAFSIYADRITTPIL